MKKVCEECVSTKPESEALEARYAQQSHIYYKGSVCETDSIGHAEPPLARSPTELVVHAADGFIPLWRQDVILRWRFQERSLAIFKQPEAAKQYLRQILANGIMLWRDSVPIKFREVETGDTWDFEYVFNWQDKCIPNGGCTLASAFFPDGGRHELNVYPKLFEQSEQEQAETMAHETGHIFGLRHFFAKISEKRWRSEIFGDHAPFSIMNYGPNSFMTENDRKDLATLYRKAWSGELKEINGTPVQLVSPFSAFRPAFEQLAAMH
ncbi:matrixin family metalloprotease [Lentilitoribacter sp. Alg239-R112]|uniref:matrixin family metalloprotease n=1 Tax=Lentilitoribacter sp. Alg239-R112 TaxID=2305987 RepID=UPI0013A6A162|nr:matrixin family metalloprotease [Lentilitoribacter sp. Alg239-R112]